MQNHAKSNHQTEARARAKKELLACLTESVDEWAHDIFEDARARGLVPSLDHFMSMVMQRLSDHLQALFPGPPDAVPKPVEIRLAHALGLKNRREMERHAHNAYYREYGIKRGRRQTQAHELAEILRLKRKGLNIPQIAKELGLTSETVRKRFKAAEKRAIPPNAT